MFVYHLNIILWSAHLSNIWFQSLVFTWFGDCYYKFWIRILCWIHLLQLVCGLLFSLSDGVFVLGTDILNVGLCKALLLFYIISNCLYLPKLYLFPCFSLTLWFSFLFFVGEHFPFAKKFLLVFCSLWVSFSFTNYVMIYSSLAL